MNKVIRIAIIVGREGEKPGSRDRYMCDTDDKG